jgi:cardiolipin synthase
LADINISTLILNSFIAINIFFIGIVLFLEKRDIGSTWAWIVVLLFAPLVGFIVYLFFGRKLKKEPLTVIQKKARLNELIKS